jgi:hypothetical protein
VTAEVETPRVPNFIRQSNGRMLPLCALEEESLREIGAAWTEDLVTRAREQALNADKFYEKAGR